MTTYVGTAAPRRRVRRAIAAAAGTLLLSAATVMGLGSAQALPPGGASPDTPGTSGTASPASLAPGDRLTFSITGFPAGEVVSVKIDDGEFCSAKGQHGACVVHQQKVGKDGSARGSFALPSDVKPGSHWLRFLASAEMLDDDGNYLGVKPYSLRGSTDFTVVADAPAGTGGGAESGAKTPAGKSGTSSPAGNAGKSTGRGSTAPAPEGQASTATPTPGVPSATAAPSASPAAAAGSSASPGATVPDAVPAAGATATEAQPVALRVPALSTDEATAAAAPVEEAVVPWIGASVLAGCVLLCSGLVAALRFGRRP